MNVWDVVVPASVLTLVVTIMILLVMSFYQTGQDAASKRKIQQTDADTRNENARMQRFESELRLIQAKDRDRG